MRHISTFFSVLTAVLGLCGCVDEYAITMDGQQDLITIDAMVTDTDTVQWVYILKSGDDFYLRDNYGKKPEPLEDVSVTVSDDNGWEANFEDSNGWGRYFSLSGHQFEVGRTYTMTVRVGDRVFSATERMVPSPKINGLRFYNHETKDSHLWSPILYFEDNQPDEDNYYLFTSNNTSRTDGSQHFLYAMPLTDVGLRGDMNGIRISLGMGADEDDVSGLSYGERYYYYLYTISKRNYDYFCDIEKHLTSDGGIYRPTPASPVSNFSGANVQGQFIAASLTKFVGRVSVDNIEQW